MGDKDRHVQQLGMQLLRESLGAEQTDEKMTTWFDETISKTADASRRRAIVSQLAAVSGTAALQLAVEIMRRDEALRETAADAAARLGRDLASSERELVKLAMQQVIAFSHNAETVKLADVALRDAARSVNLALNATVSSPDGLEPDGGSGPDAAAVDGNLATYWDETDNQPLYRFQVRFAKPTKFNTVVIVGHAYQSHSPKNFEVLCDDQVVANVTDAPYDEKTNTTLVNFPRCECTSLELKITGYYGGSPGIRELEVYDVDTGLESASYVPLPAGPRQLSWQNEAGRLALLELLARCVGAALRPPGGQALFRSVGPARRGLAGLEQSARSPVAPRFVVRVERNQRRQLLGGGRHDWSCRGPDGSRVLESDGGRGLLRPDRVEPGVSQAWRTRRAARDARVIRVSVPDDQGSYAVDWRSTFEAGEQDLVLQGGTAGGGYAGMSVRIASDTRDWRLIDGDGREDVPACRSAGQEPPWAARPLDGSEPGPQRQRPTGRARHPRAPVIPAPPDAVALCARRQDPLRLFQSVTTVE